MASGALSGRDGGHGQNGWLRGPGPSATAAKQNHWAPPGRSGFYSGRPAALSLHTSHRDLKRPSLLYPVPLLLSE